MQDGLGPADVEVFVGVDMAKGDHYAQAIGRDGTALFLPQDSSVVLQKLEPDTVKYDAATINWLGNVVQSTALLGIRKDTGVTKWEDLKTKEVFIAFRQWTAGAMKTATNGVLS